MTTVTFDESIGNLLLRYARMIVGRGYVHNSLGNLAIRVPTLGRTVSEAYHRLNTLTSEVRRNVLAEQLAAAAGTQVHALAPDAVDWMYGYAESVIYPSHDATRRPEGGDRIA